MRTNNQMKNIIFRNGEIYIKASSLEGFNNSTGLIILDDDYSLIAGTTLIHNSDGEEDNTTLMSKEITILE